MTLYVTPVGLTTSSIPYQGRTFEVEFDFLAHHVWIRTSEGRGHVIQLYAVHGFRRFLLATGHRGELIARFVADQGWPRGVDVRCIDTGA